MENIILSTSTKPIVDARVFDSKDQQGNPIKKVSIDYVVKRKSNETYQTKDWQTRNKRDSVIEFKIFDRNTLPAIFDKKSDSEICQELKGKSLITEVKIWW